MKALRKLVVIGACGIAIGATTSTFAAAPATARFHNCDQKVAAMEKQAARDFAKGKISASDYDKMQQEFALHRELWGC